MTTNLERCAAKPLVSGTDCAISPRLSIKRLLPVLVVPVHFSVPLNQKAVFRDSFQRSQRRWLGSCYPLRFTRTFSEQADRKPSNMSQLTPANP
jgi:hypothetical protein